MLIGMGSGLLAVGMILALDVLTLDLSLVDDERLGGVLLLVGLLALALSLLQAPARPERVVYVQSSRRDGITR